jgi:hypothetical protein
VSSRASRGALIAAAVVLGLMVVQAALAESPVVRYTAADQAAAKVAVLKAADLGTGWKGGYRKATAMTSEDCPGLWEPKQADLVITGVAESRFAATGVSVSTTAQVYQTARMADLDWARTVVHPAVVPCMRKQYSRDSDAEMRFVSLKVTPFPRVGDRAIRMRVIAIYTPSGGGGSMKLLLDGIAFGRGRTGVSMNVIAPYGERASVEAAEVRVARLLVQRFRV